MFTFDPPDLGKLEWSASDAQRNRDRFGDGFEGAAGEVAARIRQAAPERSGALAASVRVEREGDRVAIKAGGVPETTHRGKTGTHGAVYDYAVAIEYGTGQMDAEPFFYPGADGGRGEFDAAAKDSLSKARE